MGGISGGSSTKAADPSKVAPTSTAAMGSAGTAQALGNNFAGQQQQLFNMLYGGGSGGSGGAVSSMLDPSKLNVTSPTGVYALQNTNANTAAAKQYANNASNIKSSAQQAGFGPNTPSGFEQDQLNQNSRALADTKGQNFSTATTNQYQDALNNFWKAAGQTQNASTAAGQGALQGTNTAASTYANLYGTATKPYTTQNSNLLGNALGAAGAVGAAAAGPGGAAACCVEGTLVLTSERKLLPIEKCFEGAELLGLQEQDEVPVRVVQPLQFAMRPCVRIVTEGGLELLCSKEHTLLLAGGGYARADEALHQSVRTRNGSAQVVKVEQVGERRVVRLHLDTPHVFETNGLLSEE
jgi:hypothetical protein